MKKDTKTTIEELKRRVVEFRDARGWLKAHNPKNLAMSIAIEAAELMEIFQWKDLKESQKIKNNPQEWQNVKEEIADVVIYCLAFAEGMDIDLAKAVEEKLKKNEKRFPLSIE
jgi:NTP pyrophosphatase (non-canonical NTP hydrolase)